MGEWLDSATQAIDGLKETLQGGDPWKWVDELWEKVQQVAAYLMSKDTSRVCENRWGNRIFINICWRDNCIVLASIVYLAARDYY